MPSTADRRTHKWRDVVELVAVGADVSQVANATIRAADSAFSFVNNDSGANQAVGLMTQLGLAAEEKNPLKHLRSQGSDIPDNTSLPGVAAAITQAVEMLRKLLEGEIKKRAKEMREANARGEHLGLTEDEVAFYDALEVNDSAVKVLGDATLRGLARAVGRDGEEKPKSPRKTWRESILGRGTCDALATFWTQAAAAAPPPPAPSLASRPSGFSSSTEYGKGGRGRRPSRRTLRVGSRESRHDPPLRSSMDDEEGGSPKIELIRGLGFAIDMEFTRTHTLLVNKTFLSPRQMPTSWGED